MKRSYAIIFLLFAVVPYRVLAMDWPDDKPIEKPTAPVIHFLDDKRTQALPQEIDLLKQSHLFEGFFKKDEHNIYLPLTKKQYDTLMLLALPKGMGMFKTTYGKVPFDKLTTMELVQLISLAHILALESIVSDAQAQLLHNLTDPKKLSYFIAHESPLAGDVVVSLKQKLLSQFAKNYIIERSFYVRYTLGIIAVSPNGSKALIYHPSDPKSVTIRDLTAFNLDYFFLNPDPHHRQKWFFSPNNQLIVCVVPDTKTFYIYNGVGENLDKIIVGSDSQPVAFSSKLADILINNAPLNRWLEKMLLRANDMKNYQKLDNFFTYKIINAKERDWWRKYSQSDEFSENTMLSAQENNDGSVTVTYRDGGFVLKTFSTENEFENYTWGISDNALFIFENRFDMRARRITTWNINKLQILSAMQDLSLNQLLLIHALENNNNNKNPNILMRFPQLQKLFETLSIDIQEDLKSKT